MKDPIFILGAHKSGTSLLRSLLDGHQELSVIPIEEHVFKHLGYQIDYPYQYQSKKNYSEAEIKQNYIDWISTCSASNDKHADSVVGDLFDIELFKELINVGKGLTKVQLVELYFTSILKSINVESKRIVTKSVENSEFALDLKKMFPNAKFIHIIRNPYATLVALRKYKTKNGKYPLISKLLKSLYNDYYYLEKNSNLIDDYHVVRYEDLIQDSEETMEKISSFLSIDFNESILKPTFMGSHWGGNSTSDKVFNGLDSSPIESYKSEIFPFEIFTINNLFHQFLINNNYPVAKNKGKYSRMKGESLVKYILNRVYAYFLPLND